MGKQKAFTVVKWVNLLQIANIIDTQVLFTQPTVGICSNGLATLDAMHRITLAFPMEVRTFPFDQQQIDFK